jgi:hypothetical protein
MRLKIFFFPLAIVVSLVIGIIDIQPEVMRAMRLAAERQVVSQTEADAQTRADNVAALAQALSSRATLERSVVERYFPQQPENDIVVDMVNFLATQSGVTLTGIESQKITESAAVVETVTSQNQVSAAVDPTVLLGGGQAVPEEVVPPVTIRALEVKVSGKGLYPNVKEFLRHVAYGNRFNSISEVSISQSPETPAASASGTTDKPASGTLTFEVTIRFSFMPLVKHYKNASAAGDGSVFLSQTLNMKPVQHLNDFLERGASIVPNMTPADGVGRDNPFVK